MSSLAEDRRYIEKLYERLDAERAANEAGLVAAQRATGSSPGEMSLREAAVRSLVTRLARLRGGTDGLCFGRLDAADGTRTFVGRLGLLDEEYEPLLVDWRAPAARPFYCATAARPEGLVRRRHYVTRRRQVVAAHDDVLDAGADGVGSDAALFTALDAPRTGSMRDIVATIQAEQDEVIRLGSTGIVVIEGGPGTGKTAVALHRVAYLLYTHPQLARRGVLVVGPHPRFLEHISAVLPSLGETDVVFATPGALLPGLATTVEDNPCTARVKGSLVMVDVLAAAVRDRQAVPPADAPIAVPLDDVTVELTADIAAAAREGARATGKPHNQARPVFVEGVVDALTEQAVDRIGAGWLAPRDTPDLAAELRADAHAELRASPALRAAVDALWPELTQQRLLEELFGSSERLDAAGAVLPPADRAALLRADGAAWTVSDVPMLDEAAELLGQLPVRGRRTADAAEYAEGVLQILDGDPTDPDEHDDALLRATDVLDAEALVERHAERDDRTVAERAAADREWIYGHVVVDEAQELSEMDWRVLVRRCPTRSFTVVGDLAQRRSAAGSRSWAAAVERYAPGRWTHRLLSVCYRTPAEIMAVAAAVLAAHDPGHQAPEPVRSTGVRPWARKVGPDELAAAVAEAVHAEARNGGSVAVVTGVPLPPVEGATVLSPREVKGLEFDTVLVVEPAAMVTTGPGDLYVALTRATQRLGVLHSGPLPAGLEI
ncbi:RNA polymerase recycling motor ATPase HelR [Pseudonocardia aurantiaca]|uniref:AAA family ATPase n=1 Tax=Pseudonocardia aurantiaca TaxID=75290 RepID=A0ABW4FIE7_9PSEU